MAPPAGHPTALAATPDGFVLVYYGARIFSRTLAPKDPVGADDNQVKHMPNVQPADGAPVVDISPDGTTVAASPNSSNPAEAKTVRIWNVAKLPKSRNMLAVNPD